jgi:hypothetical protein
MENNDTDRLEAIINMLKVVTEGLTTAIQLLINLQEHAIKIERDTAIREFGKLVKGS